MWAFFGEALHESAVVSRQKELLHAFCASAGTEQTTDGLAQRSVEIDRVHALENAVGARFLDVADIKINFDPQAVALPL